MAEHWFSHRYLVQGEWGLPGEQDQSLMMGMKPIFPKAYGGTDQSSVHKEEGGNGCWAALYNVCYKVNESMKRGSD